MTDQALSVTDRDRIEGQLRSALRALAAEPADQLHIYPAFACPICELLEEYFN